MSNFSGQTRPTAVSLFSGAGGLDIAAHNAGFSTVAAIESVPRYAQTLLDNKNLAQLGPGEFDQWFDAQLPSMGRFTPEHIPHLRARLRPAAGQPNAMEQCEVLAADINDVSTEELLELVAMKPGDLDLLIGGPPCQSFSMSGKRKSIEDIRGQLFLQFARFVEDMRPRWFLFENVKGMTHSSAVVASGLCEACGPFMPRHSEVLLDPKANALPCPYCGKPGRVTSRKNDRKGALEVITNELRILGYNCYTAVLNACDFGAPQFRERVFIVGSRDSEKFAMPEATHAAHLELGAQNSLWSDNGPLSPYKTVWDALFSKPNPYHESEINPERAVLWVKNVVRPHAEAVTWDLRRPSPTVGSHQAAKLAIAPDGVPAEQIHRQQWHTLGRRQGDTPPVKVNHRYLSDSDLLELQTFPSTWHIGGTRMERAFQIGNAVPPRLGAAVLTSISSHYSSPAPKPAIAVTR
ncbi:DNA (cytosine-5)-methyltransferase 1 [Dietzia kunjamensis subsp. schimae]|uniref:DNA (cytosine-5-)-methyltransferase n=1 Tax=Dietzia kunjamensis subsp. schimae TaxID=498198 RepID=A0ABY1MZ83_9ACTN|nr:DNA cytosine methyltransferase [Dietzia kunjamensis]MBB1014978.1 DNA cytosine methyltransferase [Dietzia kunjamensis subsp. schimae]SMO55966.1 DNA (cytosine-5)-methyltransferase 1 [Dietzia kunjamensis subsp. schimae]